MGQNFTVDSVEASPEIEVSTLNSTGTTMSLQISFRPQERPGWREGQIKLRLKGLRRRELVVPFKAMVEGVVDTEPNFLNFGMVAPGESKVLSFHIVNRSGKEIRLRLVSQPSFVKVNPTKPDSSEWRVELKVPHQVSPSQIISGKIVFRTSLPLQPLLEVPVFAAVEKSNSFSRPDREGRVKSHAEWGRIAPSGGNDGLKSACEK